MISQNEAKKWSSIAIKMAKNSGDKESVIFMERVFFEDQIKKLNFDLRTVPVKSLEIYFRQDPPGGEYNDDQNKRSIKAVQKNLLRTISEIKRPLNDEEKITIERLKKLGKREV